MFQRRLVGDVKQVVRFIGLCLEILGWRYKFELIIYKRLLKLRCRGNCLSVRGDLRLGCDDFQYIIFEERIMKLERKVISKLIDGNKIRE